MSLGSAASVKLAWAQRPSFITLQISVAADGEINDATWELQPTSFTCQFLPAGKQEPVPLPEELQLFGKIDADRSSVHFTGRVLLAKLVKADGEPKEYWPRLTQARMKKSWLTVDWGRWKDEDEVREEEDEAENDKMFKDFATAGKSGGTGPMVGSGGMTMGGGGDPDELAKLQQELLAKQAGGSAS